MEVKPRIINNQIVFPKTGQSSRIVDEWLNRLLQAVHGSETLQETIQTANAGEHAMDTDLALKIRFATGYAVEPFQYIDILERFGRVSLCSLGGIQADCEQDHTAIEGANDEPIDDHVSDENEVRILQIQTCNPHFHDTGKGEEHKERMYAQGLSTIYHSGMTPQVLKNDIRVYLDKTSSTAVGEGSTPQQVRVYPSLRAIDLEVFRGGIKTQARTFNCSLAGLDGTVV